MTEEKVVNRCTGHCCECFTIKGHIDGYEGDYWQHSYVKDWQDYGTEYLDDSETALIMDMLIPIVDPTNEIDSFTCKNFNTDTRNCDIYTQRPTMCRKYPDSTDNGECQYEECTLKKQVANAIHWPKRS